MAQAAHRQTRPILESPEGSFRGPTGAQGFTLVEMMVVIAIMAMLAAIVVPSYRLAERHQHRNTCAANLKSIGQALAVFREEYQCYPPDATEFLWTEQAVQDYRDTYGSDPPGDHRLGTPLGAAYADYDGDGYAEAVDTGVHGLGLYTLYYLGAYSAERRWEQPVLDLGAGALPPFTLEPRFYDETGVLLNEATNIAGLNELEWFRGAGYITRLETFHCPSNPVARQDAWLRWRQDPDHAGVPYLGGWGNYDMFYRRSFWRPNLTEAGTRPGPYDDNRNLFEPYPPVDTVITWCPYHRSAKPPSGPGELSEVNPGDEDLVLFADGSVRRMVASKTNRPFEDPSADFGYPQGPIM